MDCVISVWRSVDVRPNLSKEMSEPGVDVAVDRMVAVAELARADALLERPRLGRRAVFVGAADVERLVAAQAAEAREDVGGEHLYEIAQMGHVVDVGKSRSDETSFHRALQ